MSTLFAAILAGDEGALPPGDPSRPVPQEMTVADSRVVDDTFQMDIEVPAVGELMSVFRGDNLASNNWVFVENLLTTSPRMRLYTSTEGKPRQFYNIIPAFDFLPGEIGFIDHECTLSSLSVADSDNYYLRQDNDHQNLDIYYNVPARLEGQITQVYFLIFPLGDISQAIIVDGETTGGGIPKLGNNLHVTWNAPLPAADSHPGIFLVQMFVKTFGDKIAYRTTVDDADKNPENGWQCPQDCLAVWDPVWRHRPILHVGSATKGIEYPIHPSVFLSHSQLWKKNGLDHPNGADEYIFDNPAPVSLQIPENNTQNHYLDVGAQGISKAGIQPTVAPTVMQTVNDHQFTGVPDAAGPPALGERRLIANKEFLFAQYWLFFDYSETSFDLAAIADPEIPYHEGDLEYMHVTIRKWAKGAPHDKAQWMQPVAATASQHYYGQTLRWDEGGGDQPSTHWDIDEVTHDRAGRPKVFVAQATHAL